MKCCSATGKAYQGQPKQGACPEYKIPLSAYLVLLLPGHPLPLEPKWLTELPAPHPYPLGKLATGKEQLKQRRVSLVT